MTCPELNLKVHVLLVEQDPAPHDWSLDSTSLSSQTGHADRSPEKRESWAAGSGIATQAGV